MDLQTSDEIKDGCLGFIVIGGGAALFYFAPGLAIGISIFLLSLVGGLLLWVYFDGRYEEWLIGFYRRRYNDEHKGEIEAARAKLVETRTLVPAPPADPPGYTAVWK